jgi:hypothetical protein
MPEMTPLVAPTTAISVVAKNDLFRGGAHERSLARWLHRIATGLDAGGSRTPLAGRQSPDLEPDG